MSDQNPSYGTPPASPGGTPPGTPSTPGPYGPGVPGAPSYGSGAYGSAAPGPYGSPPAGFGSPLTPPSGVVVPPAVRSASSILRALGIIGLVGAALGIIGILILTSMAGSTQGAGVWIAILVVSLVVGVGFSIAFVVLAGKVREGSVRACTTAVVLLAVSAGLRLLDTFPIQVNLAWILNVALIGLSILAIVRLRSAEAVAYYAAARRAG